jgi:hypothetical protein
VQQEFERPEMMVTVPPAGDQPQEPPMPMPSPLRIIAYAVLLVVLSVAICVCIQMAMMIYDFYSILQWLGGLAE